MKKNKGKFISILLVAISVICIGSNSYSHSGRTDSRGGHKDNKNKSGLGSYHYHCGGYPAHLHPNGVCPYSSKGSTSSSSKDTTSSSNKTGTSTTKPVETTATTAPTTVEASNIQINEKIEEMKVGENKKLTATITPDNTTNKNITWKSNDESIAIIDASGEVTTKRAGKVNITASTSNGKTNTIKITVKEEKKEEDNNTVTTIGGSEGNSNAVETVTTITASVDNSNTMNNNSSDDSSALSGLVVLGTIGGGSYLGYKKYKQNKTNKKIS